MEYDSLSDVVAFGVAPAALVYTWALHSLGSMAVVISGLFVVCGRAPLGALQRSDGSADKRRFTGLPVPGAAVMIAGLVLAYSYFELDSPRTLVSVMAPLMLALASLMISRVPYPSFKSINLRKRAQFELMIRHAGRGRDVVRDAAVYRVRARDVLRLVGPHLLSARRTNCAPRSRCCTRWGRTTKPTRRTATTSRNEKRESPRSLRDHQPVHVLPLP